MVYRSGTSFVLRQAQDEEAQDEENHSVSFLTLSLTKDEGRGCASYGYSPEGTPRPLFPFQGRFRAPRYRFFYARAGSVA